MKSFGRLVARAAWLAVGIGGAMLPASPQGRTDVEVGAVFFSGLDDVPSKHAAVGIDSRIYWNERWSLAPEFNYARGFGEFNPFNDRNLQFNASLAFDLERSGSVQPHLVFGTGLVRNIETNVPRPLVELAVVSQEWAVESGARTNLENCTEEPGRTRTARQPTALNCGTARPLIWSCLRPGPEGITR